MRNLDNFDWGWMNFPVEKIVDGKLIKIVHFRPDGTEQDLSEFHKESIKREIFEDRIYEKFFEVEEGDVVLDVGASLGPFTYSILHKNPKHVYCFEPSEKEFKVLVKNVMGGPITPIFKGISSKNSMVESDFLFGGESHMEGITFQRFVDLYSIEKIDFLKTDCEGGEYDIFTDENFSFIKEKVRKISGEWHLGNTEMKEKFRNFRNHFLSRFNNYQIFSVDGIDIKWDLWNENFINYYNEVIIYIDNR
jgi:FkbM family methyltransferase